MSSRQTIALVQSRCKSYLQQLTLALASINSVCSRWLHPHFQNTFLKISCEAPVLKGTENWAHSVMDNFSISANVVFQAIILTNSFQLRDILVPARTLSNNSSGPEEKLQPQQHYFCVSELYVCHMYVCMPCVYVCSFLSYVCMYVICLCMFLPGLQSISWFWATSTLPPPQSLLFSL